MIYIDADHLSDGLYNVKDGKIYKYKAKGGTVRLAKNQQKYRLVSERQCTTFVLCVGQI